MNRSLSDLVNCVVRASDGDIGLVQQFYFNDYSWTIRYMVMNTVIWRPGRQVLISPVALNKPEWKARVFPVNLTKLQVQHSPNIDTAQPVSRQHEVELFKYYGWPVYWGSNPYVGIGYPVPTNLPSIAEEKKGLPEKSEDDPHLRSTDQVAGYHVQATDGEIGHVQDYIVDDETWTICYIVVNTRNWWPGKKVLVSPRWIERVSWEESKLFVDLSRESVRNSPEYDPSKPVSLDYEGRLFGHYGRKND
ncbi:MAG: PRC-barrel domain containing protein [Verrucomicrobia bacterium]|nr:PRC-barrel domain containing protein [Verrucomicrobiota bacterium]MBU1735896.1 PRC-barrel domain containing protein [Verrucomicrobiota bacterium]MBU1857131.1 PRC-barrel domain containing protein [Verrucomicrobiota bacterium]